MNKEKTKKAMGKDTSKDSGKELMNNVKSGIIMSVIGGAFVWLWYIAGGLFF